MNAAAAAPIVILYTSLHLFRPWRTRPDGNGILFASEK